MKSLAHLLPLLLILLLCACAASPQPQTATASSQTFSSVTKSEVQTTDLDTESSASAADTSSDISDPCDHVFGDWNTVTEAKEGIAGQKERKCTLCNEIETAEIPALPEHVHSYTNTVYLADCTEDGYTERICACGNTLRENTVKATGHDFSDWDIILPSGYDVEGLQERECRTCGKKEEQAIPKVPRPPEPHVHEYTETVYDPSCTAPGTTEQTCACGDRILTEGEPPLGHDYCEWHTSLEPGEYGGLERRDCFACGEVEMRTLRPTQNLPTDPDDSDFPDDTTDTDRITDTDTSHASDGGSDASTHSDSSDEDTEDTGNPEDIPLPTITYYNQRDDHWGKLELGCGTMKSNGCGPTSIAMVLSYFGIQITPPEVATWLYENTIEFNHAFHGISGTGIRLGLEHWNRTVIPLHTYEEYISHLQNGALVIGAQGVGSFIKSEDGSHCIVIFGLTESGRVTCYDPYSSKLNGLYLAEGVWNERSKIPVDLRYDGVTHYAVY